MHMTVLHLHGLILNEHRCPSGLRTREGEIVDRIQSLCLMALKQDLAIFTGIITVGNPPCPVGKAAHEFAVVM